MKNKDIQGQWDDAADSWIDFVRKGKDWTREYLNNPAMFDLLGDIEGKIVLDLGCGEGYNSRIMAKKEADVSGVDISKKLIEYAVEEEKKEGLGIDYHINDSSDLGMFEDGIFDIVASFMTLMDIEDCQGTIYEVSRVLKEGGKFVFSITHPCFEVRILDGEKIGGWEFEKESIDETPFWTKDRSYDEAAYFKVDRYFDTRKDVIEWKMERLKEHFTTTSFHRTLSEYFDMLSGAGFLVSKLKEPKPKEEGLEKHPEYFKGNLRIPQSVIIEAVKR